MFLCLSGYLYGRKSMNDELAYYKKQFIKILVPYYIVVVTAIIVQIIFARDEISVIRIIKVLLCNGTLSGGGHLWYIPTILFCYYLTPLFDKLCNCIFKKKYMYMYLFIVFLFINIIIKLFVPYFNPAWIACFYIGYVYGKNEVRQKMNSLIFKVAIHLGTITLVSIQIVVEYVLCLKFTGIAESLFNIMCDYGHTFLGLSIVLILLHVFREKNISSVIMKPILFLDSISYEGYLVHQFFILGPFSLLAKMNHSVIAVMIIFMVTISLGFLVKILGQMLKLSNGLKYVS